MTASRPTIAFDHHDPAYRDTWMQDAARRVVQHPVAWTESHGGFWILSSYDDVVRAASDWETFSSSHGEPGKPWAKGVLIPELPYPLPLSESDPPVHSARRLIEAPSFSPKAVRDAMNFVHRHTGEAIDAVIDNGQVDFAYDIALTIAAKVALEVVGIDLADWDVFALSAHEASFTKPTDPNYPLDKIREVQARMRALLAQRRAEPRRDVLTALATRKINGQPLEEDVQVGMLSALVFGGFGTTASIVLNSLLWLDDKPEWRARLPADDRLRDEAVDELLRFFPPNHGTARTVVRDVEIRGHHLRKGDRVMLSWVAANRDPAKFENPNEVLIGRANARDHLSFGAAHHRCLGAPLARVDVSHILKEVLTRLPDYRIDRSRLEALPSFASTAGFRTMPATFTPGPRLAVACGQGAEIIAPRG